LEPVPRVLVGSRERMRVFITISSKPDRVEIVHIYTNVEPARKRLELSIAVAA
jgi:hypothetical protein